MRTNSDIRSYTQGDCPDFSRFHIRIFRTKFGFRMRTNSDIRSYTQCDCPDFSSGLSGQIRTNSDIRSKVIARISPHFTSGFSGPNSDFACRQIRIYDYIARVIARISHPDCQDKSGFRMRTNSVVPKVIARISPHFTSGVAEQIRISHADKFGYTIKGDCPDVSAFHILVFRTNPDFASGPIRIYPR